MEKVEKLYTLMEASEILNVKLRTLRSWVYKGKINVKRYVEGGNIYITYTELTRILNRLKER